MGGVRLAEHKITLGSFVMFNTYMGMLVWPMIAIGLGGESDAARSGVAGARIHEMLDGTPGDRGAAESRAGFRIRCEAKSNSAMLAFDYGNRAALTEIDLAIRRRRNGGDCGPYGQRQEHAGAPDSAPDRSDCGLGAAGWHRPAANSRPRICAAHIGYVPQETFLFSATLGGEYRLRSEGRERAGNPSARRRSRGSASDIEGFPEGYRTMVGERGITLSGGQKQRTAIARAFCAIRAILILDDALASVDTATEERILAGLSRSDARPHDHSDFPSRLDYSPCRPDLRPGAWRIGGRGHARGTAGTGGYYADLYQKQLLEEELEAI